MKLICPFFFLIILFYFSTQLRGATPIPFGSHYLIQTKNHCIEASEVYIGEEQISFRRTGSRLNSLVQLPCHEIIVIKKGQLDTGYLRGKNYQTIYRFYQSNPYSRSFVTAESKGLTQKENHSLKKEYRKTALFEKGERIKILTLEKIRLEKEKVKIERDLFNAMEELLKAKN